MSTLASFAASLYLASHGFFRFVHGGAQALFEGIWMGVLPESVYDIISQKSYGDGQIYTNAAYLDQGFYFWEELIIRQHFKPGSTVLVAAAGGGRELLALERAGYEATGFDCSRAMVAAGKAALAVRGMSATLEWAPPCETTSRGRTYDALIIGWNGYGYISPRARRIDFLKTLKQQIAEGAPVLISAAFRTPRARAVIWTPRIANAVRILTFRKPVFKSGDSFSGRPKLHFSRQQIREELEEAGYTVQKFYVWSGSGAVIASA